VFFPSIGLTCRLLLASVCSYDREPAAHAGDRGSHAQREDHAGSLGTSQQIHHLLQRGLLCVHSRSRGSLSRFKPSPFSSTSLPRFGHLTRGPRLSIASYRAERCCTQSRTTRAP
jgi:hypothetical protein